MKYGIVLGYEGEHWDSSHRGLNNLVCKRDVTLLLKILRQWIYGSSYL